MLPVLEIVQRTTDFFAARGIENARLNAELIIAHVLKLKRLDLYLQFDRPLEETELDPMRGLVHRRARREPLQYVLGEAAFGDLTLKVDSRALIPRPETEELVELVLNEFTDEGPFSILDLGTGCGAIALALARQLPKADVTAVDANIDTLSLARENAVLCNLDIRITFIQSDWFSKVDGSFDLIVANPPYLSETEWKSAQPEVRDHEPRMALVAPCEGKAALLQIVNSALGYLKPGAMLALETGTAQHSDLAEASRAAGYSRSESRRDFSGRERFFLAWR